MVGRRMDDQADPLMAVLAGPAVPRMVVLVVPAGTVVPLMVAQVVLVRMVVRPAAVRRTQDLGGLEVQGEAAPLTARPAVVMAVRLREAVVVAEAAVEIRAAATANK